MFFGSIVPTHQVDKSIESVSVTYTVVNNIAVYNMKCMWFFGKNWKLLTIYNLDGAPIQYLGEMLCRHLPSKRLLNPSLIKSFTALPLFVLSKQVRNRSFKTSPEEEGIGAIALTRCISQKIKNLYNLLSGRLIRYTLRPKNRYYLLLNRVVAFPATFSSSVSVGNCQLMIGKSTQSNDGMNRLESFLL